MRIPSEFILIKLLLGLGLQTHFEKYIFLNFSSYLSIFHVILPPFSGILPFNDINGVFWGCEDCDNRNHTTYFITKDVRNRSNPTKFQKKSAKDDPQQSTQFCIFSFERRLFPQSHPKCLRCFTHCLCLLLLSSALQ